MTACALCMTTVNSNFYTTLKKHAAIHLGILPFKVRNLFILLKISTYMKEEGCETSLLNLILTKIIIDVWFIRYVSFGIF